MVIYAKGAVGQAWQYTGDIESMPSWVKSSREHHIEIRENGDVCMWTGNTCLLVDEGDWFIMFYNGTVALYDDNAFKVNFTSSDPACRKNDPITFPKYLLKPDVIDAWQYTGEICISKLPCWIADLVLHCRLGYHMDGEFKFDNHGTLITICKGEWIVNYGEDVFIIVPDDDFKEYFEEIK